MALLRPFFLALDLIAISAIDIKKRVIPNPLVLLFACVELVAIFLSEGKMVDRIADMAMATVLGTVWLAMIMAACVCYQRILGKDGLGGGDAKLIAAFGVVFGFSGTAFALMIACFATLVFSFVRGLKPESEIPFGPFLSIGGIVSLLLGY